MVIFTAGYSKLGTYDTPPITTLFFFSFIARREDFPTVEGYKALTLKTPDRNHELLKELYVFHNVIIFHCSHFIFIQKCPKYPNVRQ